MSSDPTIADALSTSRHHDPNDLADPETAAEKEHPDSTDPFVRADAAHAEEQAEEHAAEAAELDAEAHQRHPPMEDGSQEPTPSTGAAEEGVWTEAPAPDNGFAASQFEMRPDTDDTPQSLQEPYAPAAEAAEDKGQPEATTPLLEAITPLPQAPRPVEPRPVEIAMPTELLEAHMAADQGASEPGESWEPQPPTTLTTNAPTASYPTASDELALSEAATAAASTEAASAPQTDGAEAHDASAVEPVAPQDAGSAESAESAVLTAAPESAVADRAPLDSPPREPDPVELTAGYPVQPTWAQQPTYADAQVWGQLPTYAEPAPPLPDEALGVPWAATQVESPYASQYAPYAPPVYAPPPGGYAQPLAQPATGYVPAVYAPPAPPRQRRRLPLVLGTATAVLIVAVLAVALTSYSLNLFGGPLYQNSMTSVAGGWPNDVECHFKGDGYHINSASNCYYSGPDYRDVTVTVTTKLLKGDPTGTYGIAFRRPSPNNFYVFLITGNGKWLVLKNAVPLQRATTSTAIKTGIGALNKLSVHVQGSQFTFFANGVQLGSLSDDTYPRGKVGLAGDSSLEIVFTDFAVTRG